MSLLRIAAVIAVVAGAAPAVAQEQMFYIPYISVGEGIHPDPASSDRMLERTWRTGVHLFNPTNGRLRYRLDRFVGASYYMPPQVEDLLPMAGTYLMERDDVARVNGRGPGLLMVAVDSGLIVSAQLRRAEDNYCSDFQGGFRGPVDVVEGRAALPVFHQPLLPGTTGVAGPIDLGRVVQPVNAYCAPDPVRRQYKRRVNLYLANVSDAVARVDVRIFPLYGNAPARILDYGLAPREVRQVNGVPFSGLSPVGSDTGSGTLFWLVLSADAPIVAVASTVFEEGDPGTNAFQLFPVRTDSRD